MNLAGGTHHAFPDRGEGFCTFNDVAVAVRRLQSLGRVRRVAIVDLGWASSAFAYLFDRQSRTLLADWSQDGLSGLQAGVGDAPLAGANAWFRGAGARLSLRHEAGDRLPLHVAPRPVRV